MGIVPPTLRITSSRNTGSFSVSTRKLSTWSQLTMPGCTSKLARALRNGAPERRSVTLVTPAGGVSAATRLNSSAIVIISSQSEAKTPWSNTPLSTSGAGGAADGLGDTEAPGEDVGRGDPLGAGEADGEADADGDAEGDAVGVAEGISVGVGEAAAVGVGD